MERKFTVSQLRPIRDNMTISRDAGLGLENTVTFFSLGANTSISQETYDVTAIYIGAEGKADFIIGEDKKKAELTKGDLLVIPGKTLCGAESETGAVYTEIIIKKEIIMNNIVKAGEVMKFVLMAFDEGTGLQPHRAPGNAIIFALEGKAVIGYEGKDYEISAGENFRFEKDGLHSVTANGKFKMGLLLVLE